jgi:hypothetical protein
MNSLAELDHLDLNPAAKGQVAALVQSLLDQVERDAKLLHLKEAEIQEKNAAIKAKDFKIEALTYELAHLRRMRYGVKSEVLSSVQQDLFEETLATDLAAIEAEIEQLADKQPGDTVVKPKRPRAGRQPLPDHLPRTESATNLKTACAENAAIPIWSKSVKTSPNNFMSNPLNFPSSGALLNKSKNGQSSPILAHF